MGKRPAKNKSSTPRKSPFSVHRMKEDQYLQTQGLALKVVEALVTQTVRPHEHEFFEIVLITKGRGEHITSRRRVLTAAGDVWIIRPGHWHTYMSVKALTLYNCLIGSELMKDLRPQLKKDPGAVELFWRRPAVQAGDGCVLLQLSTAERLEAGQHLHSLTQRTGQQGGQPQFDALGHLWLFLSVLSRAALKPATDTTASTKNSSTERRLVPQEKESQTNGPRNPEVLEAIDLLEGRFAEPIAMEDLTSATGLSASHLARLFRNMTGQSPMRYLAGVRVQRACRLLAGTSQSITEIAGAVGWPDPNLFSRRFREHMGQSPRAYRKDQQAL